MSFTNELAVFFTKNEAAIDAILKANAHILDKLLARGFDAPGHRLGRDFTPGPALQRRIDALVDSLGGVQEYAPDPRSDAAEKSAAAESFDSSSESDDAAENSEDAAENSEDAAEDFDNSASESDDAATHACPLPQKNGAVKNFMRRGRPGMLALMTVLLVIGATATLPCALRGRPRARARSRPKKAVDFRATVQNIAEQSCDTYKQVYRDAMLLWHPDKHSNPELAHVASVALNKAAALKKEKCKRARRAQKRQTRDSKRRRGKRNKHERGSHRAMDDAQLRF